VFSKNIGTVGTTFYVILKGEIGILVPRTVERPNLEGGDPIKEHTFVEVKTLGAGAAFGEMALIDNKPRAATIICKEDSDFAVLDKAHYIRILSEYFLCVRFNVLCSFSLS
jgi:CRP-like cAMP-binding protein